MIRRHPLLAAFTAIYCAGFMIFTLARGNTEFVFYFAVMLALIGMVLWADIRARFPATVLWLLSIWGLLHMAGGNVPIPASGIGFGAVAEEGQPSTVLYNLWLLPGRTLKYDQLVHAYGFFTATLTCWCVLRRFLGSNGSRPSLALFVITACAGMGLGATNEIVEYIATLLGPTNVGGYENNAQDLVFNAIGAVTAAMTASLALSRHGTTDLRRADIAAGLVATVIASILVGLVLASATG